MFLQPTVVHFDALPATVRQRLVACLRGHASPIPTLTCATHRRPGANTYGLLLAAGLVIGAVWRRGGPGLAASPGLALAALIALVAAASVVTVTLGLMMRGWLVRRRLPWPPGRYVLGAYLIDATREVLRVESALAVTATDVVHHRLDGDDVVTSIAFRTRDHVYGFVTRRREDARLALDRLEADLMALVDAIRYGEVDAVARLDPLFEARLDDPLPATAPAVRPVERPRLGRAPWSPRAVVALALIVGAVAGAGTWVARYSSNQVGSLAPSAVSVAATGSP